jgi:hypothetical protein
MGSQRGFQARLDAAVMEKVDARVCLEECDFMDEGIVVAEDP